MIGVCMVPTTRILLVDDHAIVRQGLRMMLEAYDRFVIVGEAGTADQALQLYQTLSIDLILLDLLMPGLNAIEAIPAFLAQHAQKILVLSSSVEDQLVHQALKAGAHGYVLKASRPQDLVQAIDQVMLGLHPLDPAVSHLIVQQLRQNDPLLALTQREHDVFDALARGKHNAEIAADLSISEGTVRTHIVNILDKLQLQNRAQVTIYALKRGFIQLDDLP